MTLQEAKQALMEGKAIKGPYFTDEEYIWTNPRTGRLEFEDGVHFSWYEFFKWRKEEDYQDGWKIVTVFTNQPEPMKYSITNERVPKEQERRVYNHAPYVRKEAKVYPNDQCTCGSGNKFKKCCR